MDLLVALAVVLVFVFILYSANKRELQSCDFILFAIAALGGVALCQGWEPGLTQWVASMDNDTDSTPEKEGMTVRPDEPKTPNYETEFTYDPIMEEWGAEISRKEKDFDQGNALYTAIEGKTDFDDYGAKGYIPGYSDVVLYNKDGADPFADLYRGATEEGRLRWGVDKPKPAKIDMYYGDGDPMGSEFSQRPNLNRMLRGPGGRADNHAAQLHATQQRRAKENLINQSKFGKKNMAPWLEKEFQEQEEREWWNTDNLYNPIQKLA